MKLTWIISSLSLALTGCGQSGPTDEQGTTAEVARSPVMKVDPVLLELWGGNYDVFHPETGVLLAQLSIREDFERWGGQITLTENFCQTDNPDFPTFCPFENTLLTLGNTEANNVALVTSGMDPFRDDLEDSLIVTMTSTDQTTVANIVLQADGGRFSIDGDFKKYDW